MMAKNKSQKLLSRLLPARFNKSLKVVPVVRLAGVIGGSGPMRKSLSLASVEKSIDKAFAVKGACAVAFAINSPGGSPVQSALIHNRIRQLAAEKELPVLTFCEDVAASGGYMLAIAGDEIYGQRFSIVGSIGVISSGFGFVDAIEKLGIERRVYTAGKNKSVLDPFQPEKKQDIDRLKKIQLDIHEGFVDMVKQRRTGKLSETTDDLFTGAFWAAPKASELGLIDGVGDLHTVLREKYGEDVKIRSISSASGFSLRKLLPGGAQLSGPIDVKVSGEIAGELAEAMEKRALWQRFGL